ncbi:hypothetical protein HK101_003495, partial [Irineochytrium annulatum]
MSLRKAVYRPASDCGTPEDSGSKLGSRSPSIRTMDSSIQQLQKGLGVAEGLLMDSVREHDLLAKRGKDVDDIIIVEVFELALDSSTYAHLTENERASHRTLQKEQKLQMIKQVYHQLSSLNAAPAPTSRTSISSSVTSSATVVAVDERQPDHYLDLLRQATQTLRDQQAQNQVGKVFNAVGNFVRGHLTGVSALNLSTVLSQLRVQLRGGSAEWIGRFLNLGGMESMFSVLRALQACPEKRKDQPEVELETLRILKVIVNYQKNINILLSNPEYLATLVLSLDAPILCARTSAIDFLLVIASLDFPNGHNLVLEAFESFRLAKGHNIVFKGLVITLKQVVGSRGKFGTSVGAKRGLVIAEGLSVLPGSGDSIKKEINDFLLSSIALLRYLVEVPIDVLHRIHLRHQVTACGFLDVVAHLRTWAPSEFMELVTHLEGFEQRAAADSDEFVEQFEAGCVVDFDGGEEPVACLDALMDLCEGDVEATSCVGNVLQNMYVLSRLHDENQRWVREFQYSFRYLDGPLIKRFRRKVLSLIDSMVAQVALDGRGLRPDFTDAFGRSIKEIVQGFVDLESMEGMMDELQRSRHRLAEVESERRRSEREISDERSRFEMKISNLEDAISVRDKTISTLRSYCDQFRAQHESFLPYIGK